MPSIRQFNTQVSRIGTWGGERFIRITTPLTGEGVGFITQIDVSHNTHVKIEHALNMVELKRWTTPTKRLASGKLQRVLSYAPNTRDKLIVQPGGTILSSHTQWPPVVLTHNTSGLKKRYRQWTNTYDETRFPGEGYDRTPPFDWLRMATLIRGVALEAQAEPLIDFLIEEVAVIAPYLTTAGWLPKTYAEFTKRKAENEGESAKKLADLARDAQAARNALGGSDDNEDRWR